MGSINCDINGMQNKVKPQLDNCYYNLESAKTIIYSINIPKDFYYYSDLTRMPSNINMRKENVKSINKWVDNVVEKFQDAETKNENLLNDILNGIVFGLGMNTSVNPNMNQKIEEAQNMFAKAREWFDGLKSDFEETGAKIVDAHITAEIQMMEEASNQGANAANSFISLIKGVGNVFEGLMDCVIVLSTASANAGTFVGGEFVPHPVGTQAIDEKTMDAVMEFVAEGHVENAYKSFYENTYIGEWMDKNANELFKSDGILTEFISGFGTVVGIAAITTLSGGTIPVSIVAGTSALGTYTEEHWANARDSSFEGLEAKYQKGEMSEEEYTSILEIRNLTDEEWVAIESLYEQGQVSEEQYQALKQIREMPEEWTTKDVFNKGLTYGTLSAIWEGVQWQVGISLDDLVIKGASKVANSAIRVGIDTAFNAFDTPFRTLIDAATTDGDLKSAWDRQGGWTSIIMNVGIGLVGSIGGELKNGNPIDKVFANISEDKYTRLVLEKVYGLSPSDIDKLGVILKDTDFSNYKKEANKLLELFSNYSDQEFNSKFGFSRNNETEFLLDIYMFQNDTSNGGKLITTKNDGTRVVNYDENVKLHEIKNANFIDEYLDAKGILKKYETQKIKLHNADRNSGKGDIDNKNNRIKVRDLDNIPAFDELDEKLRKKLKKLIIKDVSEGTVKVESLRIQEPDMLIKQFDTRYPETQIDGKRRLQTSMQIAEYFNDPYGFLANHPININSDGKYIIDPVDAKSGGVFIEAYYEKLSVEDKNTFLTLFSNKKVFSQADKECLYSFSYLAGPVYSSYCRKSEVLFEGLIFDGANNVVLKEGSRKVYRDSLEDYLRVSYTVQGVKKTTVNISEGIEQLDTIIERSSPLTESIIVSRNVNDLFCDGNKLLTFDPGVKFNDKAFLSTSADSGVAYDTRKIKLEIEIPSGEKVAYIQPEVAYKEGLRPEGRKYDQQEILLKRNSTYEIIDMPKLDENTGQLIVKARLVPETKPVVISIEENI